MQRNEFHIKPEDYDQSIVQPNITSRALDKLFKMHPLRRDGVIVDAWCRSGRLTRMIANMKPEATIIGLDSDEGMLEFARAPNNSRTNIQYIYTDYRKIGETIKAKADIVISAWHANHLPLAVRDDYLQELTAILKPGGVLLLQHDAEQSPLNASINEVVTAPEWAVVMSPLQIHAGSHSFLDSVKEREQMTSEYRLAQETIKFKNRGEFEYYIKTALCRELSLLGDNLDLQKRFTDQVIEKYLQNFPPKGVIISLSVTMHIQIMRMPALVNAIQYAGGSPLNARANDERTDKSELRRCGY